MVSIIWEGRVAILLTRCYSWNDDRCGRHAECQWIHGICERDDRELDGERDASVGEGVADSFA